MKKYNTHKLASLMTVGMMTVAADSAFATPATNFADITNSATKSASALPNAVSATAYIAGLALGVSGIFKLKEHVDSPAQVKMKDGLMRLASGGALLMLPYLTDAMSGSVTGGGSVTGPSASSLKFEAAMYE